MTPKQLSLVHVAKRELKLRDEDYRAILARVAGVASAKELSLPGFFDVMAEFERLGFKSAWRKQDYGWRAGMASPAQLRLIRSLWKEWRGEEDSGGLRHWLERFHHVSDLKFVEDAKAHGLIAALKAMKARKRAA